MELIHGKPHGSCTSEFDDSGEDVFAFSSCIFVKTDSRSISLCCMYWYICIYRERERYQYATPNISEHTVNVSEKDVVFGLRCLQLRPTGFILMGVGVSLFFWCSLNWQVLNEHPSELPGFDRRSINGIPFKGIGLVPIQERFPHASLPPEQVGKAILPRLVSKRFYCYPGLPLFTATAESCFCCVVQTCSDHSDMNMELFKDRIWYFVLQIWKLKPLL